MKRWAIVLIVVLVLLGGGALGGWLWFQSRLEPMPSGEAGYIRYERRQGLATVLSDLERRGIVRDARMARLYARMQGKPMQVREGTYELGPGMTLDEIFRDLQEPIRQMVRIPETNWARRTANLLEQREVLVAEEYMDLVGRPEEFEGIVSFPLPQDSLEGYLYPDTYDLPPLLGARETIIRQLKNFERRVWEGLNQPENLHEVLIKASLVELEAGAHEERPKIAAVIENRLARRMRLQIDAALLYGIQEWRRLTFADYREIDSPYNLYRVDGLPPGPICSPQVRSIEAVLRPDRHNYLYYVHIPGTSLHWFAETYDEHRRNIQRRNARQREINAGQG